MVRALAGVTASSLFSGFTAFAAMSSPHWPPIAPGLKWFAAAWFFILSMFLGTAAATCPIFRENRKS
jgi:hypothetical protein